MTTLAEDKDSWKAGGIIRRDFRHSHDGPETPRHVGRRKNGKKWCRGKVGRVHLPYRVVGRYYDHDACTVCGKKLTYWKRYL